MSKNLKIIISGIIAIVTVSLLYTVVPITEAFVVSYIFSIIAILGIVGSLCVYGKWKTKAVSGLSYIYISVIYAIISIIFSIIVCVMNLSGIWAFAIHTVILAVFTIIFISSSSGSNYINKLDDIAEEKHKKTVNEKKTYWK